MAQRNLSSPTQNPDCEDSFVNPRGHWPFPHQSEQDCDTHKQLHYSKRDVAPSSRILDAKKKECWGRAD